MSSVFSAARALVHRRVGGAPNELVRDRVPAHELTLVLELDLAGDRRKRGVDVARCAARRRTRP